jgi:hypothetical protein
VLGPLWRRGEVLAAAASSCCSRPWAAVRARLRLGCGPSRGLGRSTLLYTTTGSGQIRSVFGAQALSI